MKTPLSLALAVIVFPFCSFKSANSKEYRPESNYFKTEEENMP